jgi:hypothetical protein
MRASSRGVTRIVAELSPGLGIECRVFPQPARRAAVEQLFVLLLTGFTSLAAYAIGRCLLGLSGMRLWRSFRRSLELLGVAVVFLAVNIVAGLAIVLAVRSMSRTFVSVYLLNDVAVVAVSVLQGILFGCWLEQSSE